ncbi:c-AMP specific 3',5'-cyclic phosphodiesterase [Carpediemonas membranifera]|uniref:C-AMP specific 3',5'-cyclic phosphodiesterase n=1 Tax=Carpediemonas membranifera TaxID=201153 RepID=A0A8J6B208_9EUKA|nr:c-AMP specific 3',5'-cyclic phosphodiesterase [Carpediemonas membranifera]|eukprot:KAG9396735.1 c-AMP specific 3',5'-cyclic phosphodiesterase [Carpediemonas membranifera]
MNRIGDPHSFEEYYSDGPSFGSSEDEEDVELDLLSNMTVSDGSTLNFGNDIVAIDAIVNIDELNDLISSFSAKISLPVTLCTPDGNIVCQSGTHADGNPHTCSTENTDACRKVRSGYLEEFTKAGKDVILRKCPHTRTETALMPIVVRGIHFFNMVISHLRAHKTVRTRLKLHVAASSGSEKHWPLRGHGKCEKPPLSRKTQEEQLVVLSTAILLRTALEHTIQSSIARLGTEVRLERRRSEYEAMAQQVQRMYQSLTATPVSAGSTRGESTPKGDLTQQLSTLQRRVHQSPLHRLEERVGQIMANGDVPGPIKADVQAAMDDLRAQIAQTSTDTRGATDLADWLSASVRAPEVGSSSPPRRRSSLSVMRPIHMTPSMDEMLQTRRPVLDLLLADCAPEETVAALKMLGNLEDRQFDALKLHRLTGKSLSLVGAAVFERLSLLDEFSIPPLVLTAWLEHVAGLYDDRNSFGATPAFHNSVHAADVCAAVAGMLQAPSMNALTPTQVLAAVFAAITIDLMHPGVTNAFLTRTSHDLAVLYNDRSPLENHHLSAAFRTLEEPTRDITAMLRASDDYDVFRQTVIALVLATDETQALATVSRLKTWVDSTPVMLDAVPTDALKLVVMAADGAYMTRPTALTWAALLHEELHRQGDAERRLGVTPGRFSDRASGALYLAGWSQLVQRPLTELLFGVAGICGHQSGVLEAFGRTASALIPDTVNEYDAAAISDV